MGGRGSGGSNRKAAELKKLQGNQGHRDLKVRAIKGAPGLPAMPPGLTKVAQKEWKAIVPLLVRMGVDLSAGDGKALAAYCSCYAQWMLAEAEIDQHGITIPTFHLADGELIAMDRKVNPAVRVRSDALRQMKSFLIEFGLTPASRCKLEVKDHGGTQDPLEDFLSGKASGDVVQ